MKFVKKIKQGLKSHFGLSEVIIGNLSSAVISIGFTLFLANHIGAEIFGELNYFLSIGYVASGIAILGTGGAMVVFVTKKIKVKSTLYLITIFSSSISGIAIFAILNLIELSFFVIGIVMFNLITNELLGEKQFRKNAIVLILQKIFLVGLALIFYYLIGPYGIILGYGISFFPFFYRIVKSFKNEKIDFGLIKEKIEFIRNNFIQDITRMMAEHSSKIIIGPLFGFSVLGNYQIAYSILMLINLIPIIIYQYTITQDSIEIKRNALKKITIITTSILAVLIFFVSPTILPILFPEYESAVIIIQIIIFAVIPLSMNKMMISEFLGKEKTRIVLFGSIIFIATQLTGILILGGLFAEKGIAASIVISASAETVFLKFGEKINKLK